MIQNLFLWSGGLKLVRLQDRIWYRCDWKFTGSNPVLTTNQNNMRNNNFLSDLLYGFAVTFGLFVIVGNLIVIIVKIFTK